MGGGGKKEEAPADDAGGDEEKVFMELFKEVPNGADECCDEAEVGDQDRKDHRARQTPLRASKRGL